jgi:Peptidase family M28/PDZ domain/PA domain
VLPRGALGDIMSTMKNTPQMKRFSMARVLMLALAACLAVVTAHANVANNDAELEAAAREYGGTVTWMADPAREGRGAETQGLVQARDYLVEHFKKIGLKPGVGGSYIEPFEIKLGVQAKDQQLAVFKDDGKGKAMLKSGEDFNALGFSASGSFEGEAVFVGYCVTNKDQKYDSFGGAKDAMKGKVAIAFRFEPQDDKGKSKWTKDARWTEHANLTEKADLAAKQGAVALVLVNPPSQEDGVLRATERTAFGSDASIPVLHIRSSVFRQMVERAGRDGKSYEKTAQANADAGTGAPDELKGVVVSGKVELERPKTTIHNVIGVLPGSGALKNQVIIIGAHYDHLGYGEVGTFVTGHVIHPGADDNASGTAGVLMLAEYFTKQVHNQDDAAVPTPRRTLYFTSFSGEERGLLGSRYLVRHLDELGIKQEQIVAMINMDMIGRLKDDALLVMGVGTGKGLEEKVKAAAEGSGLKLKLSGGASGASDHASFYLIKVPAVHFFTGTHADYHRPSDTADKINAKGAVRVLNVVANLAESLWQDPNRIAFVAEEAQAHGGTAAFASGGAYLGIIPDYNTVDGTQGCGLDGVSPGSPAEKAGLQGGDLIVGWNGKPMGNVRDLAVFLANSKPKDKVKIKVKRKEKVIELEVELGSR